MSETPRRPLYISKDLIRLSSRSGECCWGFHSKCVDPKASCACDCHTRAALGEPKPPDPFWEEMTADE